MTKPRLAISFSGGRTSAVMTKMLLEKYRATHDISVTFANTGCEHPSTLDFVKNCDDHFGFNTAWIEAVVTHGERIGIRHKIVSYETASRDGEPFAEYIKKYGIPNAGSPQCTSRLKEEVMDSYRHRELGWKRGEYDTGIGIRVDEADRMAVKRKEKRFIYPLVSAGISKQDVIHECKSWPFDLMLPGEHYGNCVWCWKKSLRKLLTVAKNNPEHFDFPLRMEREFSGHKANKNNTTAGLRVFFRNGRSTADILAMSQQPGWEEYADKKDLAYQPSLFDQELDIGSGCGESCEIGADEN